MTSISTQPTLVDRVKSVALWGVNLAFLVPSMGMITLVYNAVPSHKIHFLSKWYSRTQMALTMNKWRANVHPDVDDNGVYIFAQNHTNHLDHIAMYNATPHFKQGLELDTHFKYPFYGWFMKARGTIPVPADRNNRSAGILRGIRNETQNGRSILTFPEGTRTLDGRVGPFRNGIFHMAIELGVPIVPVAVTGMYDVMKKGSLMLNTGHQITVHVCKPIQTASLTQPDVDSLREETRNAIAEHVDAYFDGKKV